jgi:hypothetical protein
VLRSRAVAGRALIKRMRALRSVYDTTSRRPEEDIPMLRRRRSPTE